MNLHVTILTGASEGIGAELARQLARPGPASQGRPGYNAAGQAAGKSGLDEAGAMSIETCSRLIVDGMARRQRDVVMSFNGKLGRWMKLLAPTLVDRMTLAALQKDERAH